MTKDSVTHKIRLASIDCPERKQPFSTKAKGFASEAIFGKEVRVKTQGKDRYGRYIGWVYYDEGKILNEELLKNGLAWHYRKYSKDQNLQKMEDTAREQKLGLWADKTPIPPWEWRY
ncbi:thermonuclease family protein [Gilvibacter sediminis]|uniref:thermonuclease family protein n=1 Tax=Gilvibacter sediminis TaxID=379071 RepID=UPI002350EBE6|nr:thermonuclease family protein [Gilvibacter sediminis]MDC7997033.1 thermonuclease family protein [Gilvibacter sediminis]